MCPLAHIVEKALSIPSVQESKSEKVEVTEESISVTIDSHVLNQ